MTAIQNPEAQAVRPDPAMAGGEISDEEIKALSYTFNTVEGHPSHFHTVFDCVGFARALLKRVHPTSGEDTELLDFLEKEWFYRDPEGTWSFGFNELWDAGKHENLRAAIVAAMQQGGQS